jgi:uncharacterized protein YbjQ (UPF0145 family)
MSEVIVVTTPDLPGYNIVKVLGTVHGLTVRTRGVGGKFIAGIEGIFGGEVTAYTSECEKARQESLNRLVENARRIGANAILSVDFETADILQGTATVFSAYGTAVIAEPKKKGE